MPEDTPLQRAIAIVGGQSALARHLGISQAAVWNWLNKPLPVPAEHAPTIERVTGGRVTKNQLRPDLWLPDAAAAKDAAA